MQGGEAVGGGGLHDVEPEHAGLDAGDPALRVDVYAGHGRRAQQHDVVEAAERAGVVAGALRATRRPLAAAARTISLTSSAQAG